MPAARPGGRRPPRTNRRTCTWPARALHRRHLPELAGTLHAALGLSPVAHGVLGVDLDTACAPCPAWWRCSPPPTSPAPTTAARSCTTTPSWPRAWCATWASRCSRWSPPRAMARAPRRGAGQGVHHRAAAAGADAREAHAAQQYVVPPMHLSRGDARAALAPRRTVQADSSSHRRPGAVLPGRPDQLRRARWKTAACWCTAQTQHPSEMQHGGGHALGRQANARCRCSAGAWAAASAARRSQSALFACVAALAAAPAAAAR
jgi:xanthine dehydrogenase large subunit